MPRIALIHATRLAIDPIESAARAHWPEAETISILEEGLSIDRQKSPGLSPSLWQRIVGLAKYAETTEPDGILFTCSAFGGAIEDAAHQSALPIMKPNEAMFDAAFAFGDRIAMIYTFAPAAESMVQEFHATAEARGSKATLTKHYCEGAVEAMRRGNHAEHDRLIAKTAQLIRGADVILMAQFSMAEATQEVRRHTSTPILTSPQAAILEMRRRVEARASQS